MVYCVRLLNVSKPISLSQVRTLFFPAFYFSRRVSYSWPVCLFVTQKIVGSNPTARPRLQKMLKNVQIKPKEIFFHFQKHQIVSFSSGYLLYIDYESQAGACWKVPKDIHVSVTLSRSFFKASGLRANSWFLSFRHSVTKTIQYKSCFLFISLLGVGFRAVYFSQGFLLFSIGYSHRVLFFVPSYCQVALEQSGRLFLESFSQHAASQWAFFFQSFHKKDPYKGKGLFIFTEKEVFKHKVFQKVGKNK